ncbi:hypothetical protein [Mesorhizobium sp. WSM2239]|uniref:Uncharacterized protein n=2 Tax=unclassified Mesorhizobium TaxID=325217 RepID=A0AAU8DF01_9HYPH
MNGVAGRIRDLENKVGGAYYVALCWLAMNRSSGKGSKSALETKIFGKDKPTSTFRNAWRIADKAFAEGFHDAHRKTVAELGLDEAVTFAVQCLDAHRTALGVTTMKDYEELCKYASAEAVPAPEPEEAAEPEVPEGKAEGETDADGKPAEVPGADIMANLRNACAQLTFDQLVEHGAWVAEMIEAARAATEKQSKAA